MPQLDMACANLVRALNNKSAVERYTIMHDSKYVHPGWVDYQKKCTVRRHTNENRF